MLSLVRYYDYHLSDIQCHQCVQNKFEWNPILCKSITPLCPTSCAIREACAMRFHRLRNVKANEMWYRVGVHNFSSLSGRTWYPLRGSDGSWKHTECGQGGDCFFHSVAVALKQNAQKIRTLTANCVTNKNVDELLTYYKDVYSVGSWNRDTIISLPDIADRVTQFRKVLTTSGGTYMGDDTTMRMLLNHPTKTIGFIVFGPTGILHRQVFISKYTTHLIVLMYLPGHWQLVGHLVPNDPFHRVQTTFDPFDLPPYLTRSLAGIGVNVQKDFSTWDPRLELEKKPADILVEVLSSSESNPIINK
jgi:hypothetical protein